MASGTIQRNSETTWKYLGNAKGGSVTLPQSYTEVFIVTEKDGAYKSIATAVLPHTYLANLVDTFYYIDFVTKLTSGNVAVTATGVTENETVWDSIKVYYR